MSKRHLRGDHRRRRLPSYLLPVAATQVVHFAADLHTAGEQSVGPNHSATLLELRGRRNSLVASHDHRQSA